MRKCLIIAGGQYDTISIDSDYELIIACDKGYEYSKKLGIVPNLIVGDFDSLNIDIEPDIQVEKLPKEKDDTDTFHAIRCALKADCEEIHICCAMGGRMDHYVANLQSLMYLAKRGIGCQLLGADNRTYAIYNSHLTLPREAAYLSVFSLSDISEGVSIEGAKYPLDNAVLTNDWPLGVSNEWEDDEVTVTVKAGCLAIMVCGYDH